MSIERFYASQSIIVKDSNPAFKDNTSATVSSSASPAVLPTKIGMLFKFDIPDEYKYLKIINAEIGVYHSTGLQSGFNAELDYEFYNLKTAYDESTARYNIPLDGEFGNGGIINLGPSSLRPTTVTEYATVESRNCAKILNIGAYFILSEDVYGGDWRNVVTTLYSTRSAHKPFIDLDLSTEKARLTPHSLSSLGRFYLNAYSDISFSWKIKDPTDAYYGNLREGATAEIQWRNGTSGQISSVQTTSLTDGIIPANTLPRTSNLQVRVKLVDAGGTTSYSDWTSFSTDIRLTSSDLSPASGYVDETKAKTFAWRLNATADYVFDALTSSASVEIQWRESEEGEINTIAASSLYSHTITADTFPETGYPQWRVAVTDSYGNVEYSGWNTLTTTDSQGTATPVSPVNVIVSDGAETVFRWTYSSQTGSAPSGATIQHSTDGSTWEYLKTVTGTETSTTIDLSSFAGGQFYWRVRASNNDGVEGPWSDAVNFVLLSPPGIPSVSATQTPRPTVTWQAAGQQAYQLVVDGLYDSGVVFGTGKSAKLPVILPDGQQLIKVRVQNALGLWSEYGTAAVYVENTPGEEINLTAIIEGFAAVLTWSGTADRYLVYRDGKAIGLTSEATYTDYMIVGAASYYVVGINDITDMYTVSNTEQVSLCLSTPVITDADAPVWINLRLSENNYREIQISKSRAVTYRHYTGAKYPVAESSNEYELLIGFDAAFLHREEAEALENIIGKRVIFKAKSGAYVGILSAQRTVGTFYDTFRCQLQTVDNTEEVLL